jgi:chromosomal replication initiation ATPase DnaA
MIKRIKIYNEFKNFLRELDINEFSEYEKKLINLIIDNFDNIASVSTRQGKRGKLLNKLILKKGKTISSEFLISIDSIEKSTFPFECLTSIELENFRGFSNYEKIDFSKKYTFIYGPNGSGKSSLCEALEYLIIE